MTTPIPSDGVGPGMGCSFRDVREYPETSAEFKALRTELVIRLVAVKNMSDSTEDGPLRDSAELFVRLLKLAQAQSGEFAGDDFAATMKGTLKLCLRKSPCYKDAPDSDLTELVAANLKEAGGNVDVDGMPLTTPWDRVAKELGEVTWEWPGWLPCGMLTLVCSDPGVGKSALCLRIAACYLRGDCWPDGTPFSGELGEVLWVECESGQKLNVDRARTWGLPLARIRMFGGAFKDASFDGEKDLDKIKRVMEVHRALRLIIVDSLRGAHSQDENSSRLITVVKSLAGLARNFNRPVLVIHHLRKRGPSEDVSQVTLDRVRGTSAISQMGRVIWALDVPDPNALGRKRLSLIKSNVAVFPKPLGLTIRDTGIDFGAAPEAPKAETEQAKAGEFLRSYLADGPKAETDVEAAVEAAGLSFPAAKKAKPRYGVESFKRGKAWYWKINGQPTRAPLPSCSLAEPDG